MKIVHKVFEKRPSLDEFAQLVGARVFHTTNSSNFKLIQESGGVQPVPDIATRGQAGKSPNVYFKHRRNCVSLFDYRKLFTDEEAYARIGDCNPLHQLDRSDIACLLLKPSSYNKLLTWEQVANDARSARYELEPGKLVAYRVVAHLESGYPEFLPLSEIEEAWIISLNK